MKYFLLLFILLINFRYSIGQKNIHQKEDYNCFKRYNFSLKYRLSFYPFSKAKKVMLVSFDESFEGLPMKNKRVDISKLKEIKTLSSVQIDSFTNLLYNMSAKGNIYRLTSASCYDPRNAILFSDESGKIFEYIEICFECHRTVTSSDKVQDGITCDQKFELLKSYFAKQGIKYGVTNK